MGSCAGSRLAGRCSKSAVGTGSRRTRRRVGAKYRGLGLAEAKRIRVLKDENRRLKRLVADLSLDNALLKDVVGRKW
jgi:putative transposase